MRKFHNKLYKTVYKEFLRAIKRLGISKKKFKITKSPMQITYKKNGNTIYFTGNDSIDDTKDAGLYVYLGRRIFFRKDFRRL